MRPADETTVIEVARLRLGTIERVATIAPVMRARRPLRMLQRRRPFTAAPSSACGTSRARCSSPSMSTASASRSLPLWVTSCLPECVSATSGLPQVAAELFAPPNFGSLGPRPCENARTLDHDRTSYSFKTALAPTPQAHSTLKSNPRISFSSRFEFLSFHTAWATSGLWSTPLGTARHQAIEAFLQTAMIILGAVHQCGSIISRKASCQVGPIICRDASYIALSKRSCPSVEFVVVLRSDAVTGRLKQTWELWLRKSLKMLATLETLSTERQESTMARNGVSAVSDQS
jgi:hypothetical protein